MIVDRVQGDILESPYRYIAFAVNTSGINDSGFASVISDKYWRELVYVGENPLRTVLSKDIGGHTLFALVCHDLCVGGWKKTPEVVTECLDSIEIPDDQTIACVLMGSGPVGQMSGADVEKIMGGIARSKKKVAVYSLDTNIQVIKIPSN